MNASGLQLTLKRLVYRIVPLCKSLTSGKTAKTIEDQALRFAFYASPNFIAACRAQRLGDLGPKTSMASGELIRHYFGLKLILGEAPDFPDGLLIQGSGLKGRTVNIQ